MAIPPVTPLPTPPSRSRPDTFATEADAFLGALDTFGTQLDDLGDAVEAAEIATAASETAAAASETAAAASEAAAATSESNAAASEAYVSQVGTIMLGSKASDPTLDNDGNPLQEGAIYYNTTVDQLKIYSNGSWITAAMDANGALIAANNLSDLPNTATARTNLGVAVGTDVLAYDANLQGFVDTFTLPTTDGTSGQVLSTDGSGAFSLVDGGGSPVLKGTASGAISAGDPVVVNSDATLSALSGQKIAQNLGNQATLTTVYATNIGSGYDSAQEKVFTAYRDVNTGAGGVGYARIGTVSGDSITYGGGTVWSSGQRSAEFNPIYDPATGKMVVFHNNGAYTSERRYGTVVTISGNSWSRGSHYQLSTTKGAVSPVYDTTNQVPLVSYNNGSGYPVARVVTVSGTTLSFGAESVAESNSASYIEATYDSTNEKVVLTYRASNVWKAAVGTVSGTTITFGTPVTIGSGNNPVYQNIAYNSDTGKILSIAHDTNADVTQGAILTVNGNSLDVELLETISNDYFITEDLYYDTNAKKWIAAIRNNSFSNKGELYGIYYDGESIILDEPAITGSSDIFEHDFAWDTTNNKGVVTYRISSSQGVRARVYQPGYVVTNLTEENFLGFSKNAYTNGETAEVNVVGSVEGNQTGLTAGKKFYVNYDASLDTNPVPATAEEVKVYAGVAATSTDLLVKG